MSDFESRLRDTLEERAAAAPDAIGLAEGARRRLRRRRTTWAVATAAVVAATVPLGLSQVGGGAGGGTGPADGSEVDSGLPPGVMEWGYRAESWHDVTFEVPVEWGYGGVTAWCASGASLVEARPVVARPDSVSPAIACSPAHGYGVTIGSAAAFERAHESGHVWQFESEGVAEAQYPDGAWLASWYDADTVVTVIALDHATARRLVDSVQEIDGVDPNECPVRQEDAEAAVDSTSDSFSICRYDEEGVLTASRRLIGVEAVDAQTAILSAPVQDIDHDCPDPGPLPRTVLLQGGGYVGTVVTDAPCEGHNGVFLNGVVRMVNDAVRREVDLTRLP